MAEQTAVRVRPETRKLIEMQGFGGSDAEMAEYGPWLRLAPAICMVWVGVATALASALGLALLLPFAVLGAVLPGHPFEVVYTHGVRRITGGARIPTYGAPRRFACVVASVWILAATICFAVGWTTAGYVLGGAMVCAAAIPTFTGFCLPSFIYTRILHKDYACPRPAPQRTSP
jgi:hypothetical protein